MINFTHEETLFINYIFATITGSDIDEFGEPYIKVYEHELRGMLDDLKRDSDLIFKIFGTVRREDVETLLALQLARILDPNEYNADDMRNFALKWMCSIYMR